MEINNLSHEDIIQFLTDRILDGETDVNLKNEANYIKIK